MEPAIVMRAVFFTAAPTGKPSTLEEDWTGEYRIFFDYIDSEGERLQLWAGTKTDKAIAAADAAREAFGVPGAIKDTLDDVEVVYV